MVRLPHALTSLFGGDDPDPSSADLYKRLGLSREASAEEIKDTYYSLIREYPPERFQNECRGIQEAYETLSDREARAHYDAQSDPAVNQLVEKGFEAASDEDYDTAIARFRKALVLRPDAPFIRQMLGQALRDNGDLLGARDQLLRLTQDYPNNFAYWNHLGFAQWNLDENAAAERSFRHSLQIEDQENEAAHVGLSRALNDQGKRPDAIRRLEEAIQADGVVDFEDFTYFFELVRLYTFEGDTGKIEETTRRIEDVLTEDWQTRRAAYQFARFSHQLVEHKQFSLALTLAERSQRMLPDDEFIDGLTQYVRHNKSLIEEWSAFQDDEGFRGALKFLFLVLLQDHFGDWETDEDRENRLREANEALNHQARTVIPTPAGHRTLADEIDQMEYKYFRLSNLLNESTKAFIRQASQAPTQALITCPHCDTQANAPVETARLVCPQCQRPLDYNAGQGKVSKWSGSVEVQRAGSGALQVGLRIGGWILAIALLGMCFGG